MPMISQLPPVNEVTAADEVPLSQSGATSSISVGTLLAGTQPAIITPTGTLLGRTSLGPGGPEAVTVGEGLALSASALTATGLDHAGYSSQSTLFASDQAVISSDGTPKLLQLSLLRELFVAGANISIDPSGTISATTGGGFGDLPTTQSIGANDLVVVSQSGTDLGISYSDFLDGQTIDAAQPAVRASDEDTLWVAQGTSTMVRQTLGNVWVWASAKLPTYKVPVVEISTDTTLDGTVHNGRILVCSQAVKLQPASTNMGSGFTCTVLNLSGGSVVLGTGVTTSTGSSVLPIGASAVLQTISYSGGTITFAAISAGPATSGTSGLPALPGQVIGLVANSVDGSSVTLSWLAPSSGGQPSSYAVQSRATGTANWSTAITSAAPLTYLATGLVVGTSYDFQIIAVNAAGSGVASSIVNATPVTAIPGQVTGVVVGSRSLSTVALSWTAATNGGAPIGYTIQSRITGTTNWSTVASGLLATSRTVSGLVSGTQYDFQVMAVNSAGAGPPSAIVTAATISGNVTSITWNLPPAGPYARGSGSIGLNVLVVPADATVQFGFSPSVTDFPTSWSVGVHVNTNVWAAYAPTPTSPGTWYAWAEGTDGSALMVYPTGFTVS